MNPAHLEALVADLRDCARRARQLSDPNYAAAIHALADDIQRDNEEPGRSSLPPVLASNIASRGTATRLFQNARRILAGIK